MAKNFLILLLGLACAALAYLHFGIKQPEPDPCPVCPPVEETVAEVKEEPEKLNTEKIIEMAQIHGISLATSLEEVDEKLESAGFKCAKTDSTSGQSKKTTWLCKHKVHTKSFFNLRAQNDELKGINRSGIAYISDMDITLDHIDLLKTKMKSREGMRVLQSEKNLTFQIDYKNEAQDPFLAKYNLKYFDKKNPDKNANPDEGFMSVSISRP